MAGHTNIAMKLALGFAALCLPLAAAPAQASSAAQVDVASAAAIAAQNSQITDVLELERERYRRLTVPVTIMGEGPFRFLIDTGAQATVLSLDLADRLQLTDRQSAMLVAMASSRQVETAEVRDFTLGSRSFTIATAPLLHAANIGGMDGILGLDSLQDQRVLLDFAARTISVTDARDLGGDAGFDIVVRARSRLGQLIITRAVLDGVRTAVIVDTGAQGSVGNPALAQRLRRARVLGEGTMTDVNGAELSGAVRVGRSLELGSARLNNFPIVFAASPSFAALGLADEPALILGMDELRLFDRVAIDFRTRRVLFDLPEGAGVPSAAAFLR